MTEIQKPIPEFSLELSKADTDNIAYFKKITHMPPEPTSDRLGRFLSTRLNYERGSEEERRALSKFFDGWEPQSPGEAKAAMDDIESYDANRPNNLAQTATEYLLAAKQTLFDLTEGRAAGADGEVRPDARLIRNNPAILDIMVSDMMARDFVRDRHFPQAKDGRYIETDDTFKQKLEYWRGAILSVMINGDDALVERLYQEVQDRLARRQDFWRERAESLGAHHPIGEIARIALQKL